MSARTFIILALVVVVSKVQAAATLRGVVLANGKGGPPMGNVVVSAVGGNTNNTGADGRFTLTFPDMNPGDTVLLTVSKEGYVVVNDIQLEWTLPAHPDARPAIFLMCKEGDREEMARRFYTLKSLEEIDKTYRKKFEEAQNASAAELAKLAQERDQAKEAAEKAAEGLAKQKPGGSELYRTAMRLFLYGKVDQALVTLNDEKLRELSKAAKERKAEAEKATQEAIQNWLLKAQLLTVQFRFDDGEKAYQEAIDTSPESFKANFAFARFNQQLNHYNKAISGYRQCLDLARHARNNDDIAVTLNNLALLERDQNRQEAAREEFEEALKMYRELAQKNPDTYLAYAAMTLNNLATLDQTQNRPEAARKGFEETLKIRQELAQKNPDTYLDYVATTLNDLAILDRNQNRMEAARKEFEEALKINRELAQKNPDAYLPDVGGTLNNLAILDRNQNRMEAARKGYEEALTIYRELAQKNPDTYLADVAMTLNNLANLDRDQNRQEPARKELEEALDIYERFAERNPERFQSDVSRVKRQLQTL